MYSNVRHKGIFIIHSERDNNILNELKDFFHQQLFLDANNDELTNFILEYLDSKTGDYVGEVYSDLIKENFQNCYYYLIIITENSKKRVWVNQEIGYALATNENNCLIMVDDKLEEENFGFIHSHYFVQHFGYDDFKISENGEEIINILNTITKKFGDRIPKSRIMPTTDEIRDRVKRFNSLIHNRGVNDE